MNKILALFSEPVARDLLTKEVLPLYPDFKEIIRLHIKPYKKLIWETTYHVVIAYRVVFARQDGGEEKLEIVCSAHSSEPREVVHKVLNFLWRSGLADQEIILPRPLFYSREFNGTFYRAIEGKNLLNFIKDGERNKIEAMVAQAARLLARLHAVDLPADMDIFSEDNRFLRSVVPGRDMIVKEIKERFKGAYVDDIAAFYEDFIAQEETFFANTDKRWLIHGDAHPENIIAVGEHKIGIIDFTDFCPADFARDLGAFLQQLEYKIIRNLDDHTFALEMKHRFLDAYLQAAGLSLDQGLQARIDLYYRWTAIRTATFWLLKHNCEPEKAAAAIQEIKNNISNKRHAQD
jgi:aminoglycoside phosphotransferase (APT) family kinase protein